MSFWDKIKILITGDTEFAANTVGTLYAVAPNNASADQTVARALDTATRVNNLGNIETVVANKARIDYGLGITKCPNLLVESTFVNAIKRSTNFELAGDPWNKNNVVTTPNVVGVIDPKGLQEATFVAASVGSAEHNLNANSTVALTTGQTITYSAWVKAATSNIVQLVVGGFSFTPANPYVNFGLIGDGIIYAGNYSLATIEKKPNGWYKCSITASAAANGTPNVQIGPILTTNAVRVPVFVGDGVTGVYVHNTQIIIGAIPLSDVFTSGAAATKNADVISKTGLTALNGAKGIFADFYLQAGVLTDAIDRYIFAVPAVDNDNANFYRLNDSLYGQIIDGGVTVVNLSSPIVAPLRNKRVKMFLHLETNNVKMYINGALVGTDVSCTIPTDLSRTSVGRWINAWDGLIKAVGVTDELTTTDIDQFSQYATLAEAAEEMVYTYES